MKHASWHQADQLGIVPDVEIAVDTVLKRKYETAPVSSLYLFGRRQDFCFERLASDNPRHRHHVRFWKVDETDIKKPVWIGSASFDDSLGISPTTGQVTHHIAADVDQKRDFLAKSLEATGDLVTSESFWGCHWSTFLRMVDVIAAGKCSAGASHSQGRTPARINQFT